ncbi:MAG: transketolase [Candidatus Magasanikbacteria bacterium RIFCSPLOWO2_12_FULL_34_7]|nr:MAG: transketolase [Candidatus Magasanikbacteria bacterium RIFCSPLOWO2_12_FULL_34_7]
MTTSKLKEIAKLIRYYILISTTKAGSGHPTSSLSATDIMTALFFDGHFKFDASNPNNPNNDRLLFSKGHASPLFYALWAVAGNLKEKDLLTLRKFGSPLEGHPTMKFPFTEAATGSLGQGLSVGVGIALNAKYLDKLPYYTYVLLGDSEMAEGSVWEAIDLATYYNLDNLIAIVDVNRLGQRGETKYGHDTKAYAKRVKAFGWETIEVDGHNIEKIINAIKKAKNTKNKPIMIVAKTIKGKGVSFAENKDGWHGKALTEEQLAKALTELGEIKKTEVKLKLPKNLLPQKYTPNKVKIETSTKDKIATRKAYGTGLLKAHINYPNIVVLDAETSNSTFAETFKNYYPNRFFEMFIAEQNMVGTAIGLSSRGKIPFVSTFAAFLSRAYDQIRMTQYSNSNIKFVGSHAGVSIGEDGSSQMGLEDISMFRSIHNSVVLYPSDAVSTEKLVMKSCQHKGVVYIRTTRQDTSILYKETDTFEIGGSKILRKSENDIVTIVSAGITLHEALSAYEELKSKGINIRIIDLYCIKPIDTKTLLESAQKTKAIITVEDHYEAGGLGEAVKNVLSTQSTPVYSLFVDKIPMSGTPQELLDYEGISKNAIIKAVNKINK